MEIESGLARSIVLQRDRNNVSQATLRGASPVEGVLQARATKGGKVVRGWAWRKIGSSSAGRFEGALAGLPCGGPYQVDLRIIDSAGKAADRASVRDVTVGDVWIAAGQSNMQGCGLYGRRLAKIPLVRAFYMDDVWRVASEPIHNLWDCVDEAHVLISGGRAAPARNMDRCIGPAVSFAQEMFRRTRVPQGVIACSHGGSSMAQWDPAGKSEGGRSLYGAMLRRVARNGGAVAGMIWYQGESDVGPGQVEVYSEKMANFIDAVRRDCGDPGLPVAIVQISRCASDDANRAGWNLIQNQQRLLPGKIRNLTAVPAVDLGIDDLIHIGGNDQHRLGRRLAQAIAVLKKQPRAGKPPIELDKVTVEQDGFAATANVIVQFRNVSGRLQSAGRPSGFALTDPRPVNYVYDTILDGSRVIVKTSLADAAGMFLNYGLGTDPYCNITDQADRSLPAFCHVSLGLGRALTPFVRGFRRSQLLPAPQRLPDEAPANLELAPYESGSNFCDLHQETGKVREDRLLYFACRLHCREDMDLIACLGYDGPVKLWIDGKELAADLNGNNPAIVDRIKASFRAAGDHDVLVALNTNGGRAWGIFLRFERTDVAPEIVQTAPEKLVLPTIQ